MKEPFLRAFFASVAVALAVPALAIGSSSSKPRVLVVDFPLEVNPVTANYLDHQIHHAQDKGYNAVVIKLDTPGGLSDSMRTIVKNELSSKIPVIVYVAPQRARARPPPASGSVRRPTSWRWRRRPTSALRPRSSRTARTSAATSGARSINDAAASLRGLAQVPRTKPALGRPRRSRKGANITADQALRLNVIDDIAPSLPVLLDKIDGKKTVGKDFVLHTAGAQIDEVHPGFFTRFLNALIDPNILPLLFLAGLAGIGFEIFHPGVVLPGALGAVALVTALFGFAVLPISWAGLALILLGVALLVIDAHVASHGALTVSGLIALVVGCLMLFHNAPPPYNDVNAPLIIAFAVGLGVLWAFAIAKGIQIRAKPGSGRRAHDGRRGRRGPARRPRVRQRRALARPLGGRLAASAGSERPRLRGRSRAPAGGGARCSGVGSSPDERALIVLGITLLIVLLFVIGALKVAREYERGIIFRLGRLLPQPKGPGLFILIPIVDRMVKVDLRTITLNVPPQDVITKDNVPVRVNAVAYFRIVGPSDAVVQVENYLAATSQIAQTTLRSVLGQHLLDELLSERDKINSILQGIIDEATSPWGIKVSIVEIKDVEIPSSMQRAMARQAEAERERRAKIISSEGEFQASERLKDAALVLEKHPTALQLRYLQTLIEISGTPSTTIVFPAPIDLLKPFLEQPNEDS